MQAWLEVFKFTSYVTEEIWYCCEDMCLCLTYVKTILSNRSSAKEYNVCLLVWFCSVSADLNLCSRIQNFWDYMYAWVTAKVVDRAVTKCLRRKVLLQFLAGCDDTLYTWSASSIDVFLQLSSLSVVLHVVVLLTSCNFTTQNSCIWRGHYMSGHYNMETIKQVVQIDIMRDCAKHYIVLGNKFDILYV